MRMMRLKRVLTVMVWGLVAFWGASPATAATTPELRLEEAIYQEETVGDVAAALALYRQIIDDGDGS